MVKREPAPRHACPWPGCAAQLNPALFACSPHWFKLPAALRGRIWRAYVPGQSVATWTPEYRAAFEDAQAYMAVEAAKAFTPPDGRAGRGS